MKAVIIIGALILIAAGVLCCLGELVIQFAGY